MTHQIRPTRHRRRRRPPPLRTSPPPTPGPSPSLPSSRKLTESKLTKDDDVVDEASRCATTRDDGRYINDYNCIIA
eukprot:1175640-Prorocentrum_minimum.AAC.2